MCLNCISAGLLLVAYFVISAKVCDAATSPTDNAQHKEGDLCTTDGDKAGVWTFDEYCVRTLGATESDLSAGCCKTNSISGHRCQEYAKKYADVACDKSDKGPVVEPFSVELYDANMVAMSSVFGVLIAEHFVLTKGGRSDIEYTKSIKYVRVALQADSPLIEVASEIECPHEMNGPALDKMIVLRLKRVATLSADVRPICLGDRQAEDESLRIAGFPFCKNDVLEIPVTTLPDDECRRHESAFNATIHKCGKRTSTPYCYLRPGSAIISQKTGAHCSNTLIGILKRNIDCTSFVYNPIQPLLSWIDDVLRTEGESCLIDGTVGLWTYDERFCASRSGDTLRGCCRLASKSAKMCIEYGRQMTVDGCGKPEDHPFMVELFDSRRVSLSYCDGTLISDHFVLTDAWCLKTHAVSYVRIGTATLTPLFRVSEAIVHPEYDGIIKNDVGLLRILDKITFTPEIHPVCLPQLRVIEDEAHTMVAYESVKSLPAWLINVTRMGDADCGDLQKSTDAEQHFCMMRSTSHPCNIKVGSPLLVDRKDTSCLRTLAGIKVWNTGCEKLFFMRIFPVLDWIEKIVWK